MISILNDKCGGSTALPSTTSTALSGRALRHRNVLASQPSSLSRRLGGVTECHSLTSNTAVGGSAASLMSKI